MAHTLDGRRLTLTPAEFRALEVLASVAGAVVTRDTLSEMARPSVPVTIRQTSWCSPGSGVCRRMSRGHAESRTCRDETASICGWESGQGISVVVRYDVAIPCVSGLAPSTIGRGLQEVAEDALLSLGWRVVPGASS